jgi:hypothetical protein
MGGVPPVGTSSARLIYPKVPGKPLPPALLICECSQRWVAPQQPQALQQQALPSSDLAVQLLQPAATSDESDDRQVSGDPVGQQNPSYTSDVISWPAWSFPAGVAAFGTTGFVFAALSFVKATLLPSFDLIPELGFLPPPFRTTGVVTSLVCLDLVIHHQTPATSKTPSHPGNSARIRESSPSFGDFIENLALRSNVPFDHISAQWSL